MKPRASFYSDILPFGGMAAPGGPASAQVGGWLAQPNLASSYLLAARHVIEAGERDTHLNEVALPAAFLQRHAMELAIKSVVETTLTIKRSQQRLALLATNPNAEWTNRPPADHRDLCSHNFSKLLSLLGKQLADLNFGPMPDEIGEICSSLQTLEDGSHVRLRYPSLRNGRPSFPQETTIKVGEMQDRLERLFLNEFTYQPKKTWQEDNFITQLADIQQSLEQQLLAIIPFERL